MPHGAAVPAILIVSAALWAAGLRLFVRSSLGRRWKVAWTAVLLLIGVCIGVVLPLQDVWKKFLWVMAVLPVIAAADVFLFRSSRGLTYWIRACGFEAVTVFAVAAAARYALDAAHIGALAASG